MTETEGEEQGADIPLNVEKLTTLSKKTQTLVWRPKSTKPAIHKKTRGTQTTFRIQHATKPKIRHQTPTPHSDSESDSTDIPADDKDIEYLPDTIEDPDVEHFEEMIDDDKEQPHKQKKYVVFQSALLMLFTSCIMCRQENKRYRKVRGSMVTVKTVCPSCSYTHLWDSQPRIRNIPLLNILLSAAIAFTGLLPNKTLRLFKLLNIQCHAARTFFHHQRHYLHNAVSKTWKASQEKLFAKLEGKDLTLAGDARCDSMGHSAKFGSYCLLEVGTNKILSLQLVQSNETKGSYHMELEGLKRCRQELSAFNTTAFISDRHRQIAKWVRENWAIKHCFDCWHIVKGMTKKMEALSRRQNLGAIKDWIQSLKCHLYWCALSSKDGEEIKEKWLACVDHIQNRHDKCSHPPLTKQKKWLKPGSEACEQLVDPITKTMFINDIMKMSSIGQTSGVESYHSLVNQFAPKMYKFSHTGMVSRITLAALHYNENAGRPTATTKEGEHRYKVAFPKYKSGDTLCALLESKKHMVMLKSAFKWCIMNWPL
ncbi:PREDICTED: uncharacterized protein LOC106814924 [Priapulus caudatus]|uniref:Uncharacterized protein LOC106814924 n=1 Tax=Priapulus caudatus TaxID=37621 RepID=A0ABM1ERH1_PRICU|nr:PREDICTED: uncharacterized protein LOC106814924 [Priapulus caudatus]